MAKQKKQTKGRVSTKTTGLYEGKAGDYAAQQQPQNYFNSLTGGGGISGSNPAYDDWLQNEGFGQLYNTGYQSALAGNERLTFKDYMQQAGGAGLGGQLQAGFNRFQAQTQPQAYFSNHLLQSGAMDRGNLGSDYAAALQGDVYGLRQAQYFQAQQADPTLAWDEWLSGNRAPLTGALNPGGTTFQSNDGAGKKKKRGKAKG